MKRGQDNVLVLMFFTSISTVFNRLLYIGCCRYKVKCISSRKVEKKEDDREM